jgi:hypothetical protein
LLRLRPTGSEEKGRGVNYGRRSESVGNAIENLAVVGPVWTWFARLLGALAALAVGQLGVGVALGRFDCRPALWQVGQPSRLLFQFSQHLLIDFKRSASKIQNMNFPMPKNFQNLPGGRKFPKGTFWEKVQITNGL